MGDRQTDSIPADNKAGCTGSSRQVSRDGFVFPNAHPRVMDKSIFMVCCAVYLAVGAAVLFSGVAQFFYAWGILGIVASIALSFLSLQRAMTVVVRDGNVYLYEDDAQRRIVFDAPYDAFYELRVDCYDFGEQMPMSRATLHLKAKDNRIQGREVRLILDRATDELPREDRQAIDAVATEMGLVVKVCRH